MAKKQTWNERRRKLEPKPIMGKSEQGEIKHYFLTPEELEYYRNLKPPIKEKNLTTTAHRNVKPRNGQI